ncbi:hypothetical protein P154DRAFT_525707 [Amniculicola lignicola CBS 123094]|uniref:Uncharacterized protein n=1 Tax=Amniculicola lignicola CBS 123094 TaxID=1392246 RepID=A0A6A5W3A2_9PLEO|nr:hypothetical protein P154DRAFT_525707 [Amniculicola lignicola CBS 123094]
MQNERSQGISHAQGDSKVPDSIQKKAPQGLEESLPNKVHETGSTTTDTSSRQTHAKDGGAASKVPLPIQKAVPEKLERALPNSIHDTGDKK